MSQNASINNKLEELKANLDWFYSDDFDIAQAVEKYESAARLAKSIESDLLNIKNRIEVIAKDFTEK